MEAAAGEEGVTIDVLILYVPINYPLFLLYNHNSYKRIRFQCMLISIAFLPGVLNDS